jgi:hypothetical protein
MAMLMLPAPQQLTYPWCLAALGLRAKAFDIDVEEETRVGEIGVTFSVRPFQSRSILRQPSIRSVSADASALPWKRAYVVSTHTPQTATVVSVTNKILLNRMTLLSQLVPLQNPKDSCIQ